MVKEAWQHLTTRTGEIAAKKGGILLLGTVAAVISALAVLLIGGLFSGHWEWVTFGGDLMRNVLVGTLLAGAVAWGVEYQNRRERAAKIETEHRSVRQLESVFELAANGWSPLGNGSTNADSLLAAISKEKAKLTEVFDNLERIHELKPDEALSAMHDLKKALSVYMGEGNRQRRKLYFRLISGELAELSTADDRGLAESVRTFRATIPALLAWYSHTDTVIIEQILVEPLVPPAGLHPPTQEEMNLIVTSELSAAVAVHEPLYLLYTYSQLHSLPIGVDIETVERLRGQVNRCVGALRNEVHAVIDCLDALVLIISKANSLINVTTQAVSY